MGPREKALIATKGRSNYYLQRDPATAPSKSISTKFDAKKKNESPKFSQDDKRGKIVFLGKFD